MLQQTKWQVRFGGTDLLVGPYYTIGQAKAAARGHCRRSNIQSYVPIDFMADGESRWTYLWDGFRLERFSS